MKNIHICLNEFTNPSRVLKQVQSLTNSHLVDKIKIIAIGSEELPQFEKINEKIELYRIRLLSRNLPKSTPFQVIKYLEFSLKSLSQILKFQPDIVNAHSLGVLPIALLGKLLLKNLIVYDAHELETERLGIQGIKKNVAKFLERRSIKHIDLLIVVSESIADWYAKEYQIQRPVVVYNAPKTKSFQKKDLFRQYFGISKNKIILLYQGSLMPGRGIEYILDAIKNRNKDDIAMIFMGYGPLEDKIKLAATSCKNIFFHPAVPPNIVLNYTSSADIGISYIENSSLSYYYCMPNKLFEYAMAGLPVLVSNTKDMSEFVRNNNMGFVIESFSSDDINLMLDYIQEIDLTPIRQNSFLAAYKNSWEKQEVKMINAYKSMLKNKNRLN